MSDPDDGDERTAGVAEVAAPRLLRHPPRVLRRRLTLALVLAVITSVLAVAFAPPPPIAEAVAPCQRSRGRRRSRGPRVTAAERRAIKRRHTKAPRASIDRWLDEVPPPLVLRPVNGGGEFILTPENDEGTFGDDDLLTAETAMASREDGSTHPIHPRLLDLVYQAARHFRAPWVYVISGYRPDRSTSRHTHGRAMDFVLPGTTDRRLAAWLRDLGFVGVGIYTTSGFVHLDVRSRSYFWRDSSGPREANRERPMLRDAWARADREARRDGVEPTSDDVIEAARAAEREAAASAGEPLPEGEGGEGSVAVVIDEVPPEGTVELELADPVPDAGLADAPDAGAP